MLKKPKVINGTLVLVRVEASQDFGLVGNRLCCGCEYLIKNCVLSGHDKRYQFCLKVTPATISRKIKFVYIYAEEKEIL